MRIQGRSGDGLLAGGVRDERGQRRLMTLGLGLAVWLLALLVAACGSAGGPSVKVTYPPFTPVASATATAPVYAYLYSRVDYPLQIAVNAGDTVTLTLSPQSNILTVTPGPGSGTTSVGNPIPLPTNLSSYRDIGAAVDVQDAGGSSPIVWQLRSPIRQSLLTPPISGEVRRYLDQVVFQWRVQAVAAGQNTAQILLHLYYVYLDGSEHDGTIQMTQAPIPIVAVQPSPLTSTLPSLKLPLAGLTWLASVLAVIRFLWQGLRTLGQVAEPVKDVAEVAAAVRSRVAGSDASQGGGTSRGASTASPAGGPPLGHWPPAPHGDAPAGYPGLGQQSPPSQGQPGPRGRPYPPIPPRAPGHDDERQPPRYPAG
jgi:hypothetical protein